MRKMTNEEYREHTGCVSSTDHTAAFLYILMRDKLPVGEVEEILMEMCEHEVHLFTNGWLAKIAVEMSERLHS